MRSIRDVFVRARPFTLPILRWFLLALVLVYLLFVSASAIRHGRHKDFGEFFLAADAMRRGQDIYAVGADGYIYPPLLAFLLIPAVPLGLDVANVLWLALNTGLLLLSVLVGDRTLRDRLSISGEPGILTTAAHLAVVLSIDKLHAEFVFGQSDLWTLAAWALGLAWLDRRPVAAGLVLGLAANIKYLTLLTVPYMILRKRYKTAAATVGAAIGWALLPAIYVGWEKNLGYWAIALRGLSGMVGLSPIGESARVSGIQCQMSVSITSWAVRVTSSAGPTPTTLVLLVAIGSVLFAAIAWMYHASGVELCTPQRRRGQRGSDSRGIVALEWIGLLAAALAFSPQTGSRHLSVLVLVCLVALVLGLAKELQAPRWPALVGIALLTAGLVLPPDSPGFCESVRVWHFVAGPSWCLVVMYLGVLWTGLRHCSRVTALT